VAEKTEKPTCLKRPIDPKDIVLALPHMADKEYDIIAEV